MDKERQRKYREARRRIRFSPWEIGNGANDIPPNVRFRECDEMLQIKYNRRSLAARAIGYLTIAVLIGLAALLIRWLPGLSSHDATVLMVLFSLVLFLIAAFVFHLSGHPFSATLFFYNGIVYLIEIPEARLTGLSCDDNRLILKTENIREGEFKAPDMMPAETQLWIYRKLNSRLKRLPAAPESLYPMPIVLPLSRGVKHSRWKFLVPLVMMVAGLVYVINLAIKTYDHPERNLLYIALGMITLLGGSYLSVLFFLSLKGRKIKHFLYGIDSLELSPDGIAFVGKNAWQLPLADILEVYVWGANSMQPQAAVRIYSRDGKCYPISSADLKTPHEVGPSFFYWNRKYAAPQHSLDPLAENAELNFLPSRCGKAKEAMKNAWPYLRAGIIFAIAMAAMPWISEYLGNENPPKLLMPIFSVIGIAGIIVVIRIMRKQNWLAAKYHGVRVTPKYLEFLGDSPLRISYQDMNDRKIRPSKITELMLDPPDEKMQYKFSFEYQDQIWQLPYSLFMDAPNAIQILSRHFT